MPEANAHNNSAATLLTAHNASNMISATPAASNAANFNSTEGAHPSAVNYTAPSTDNIGSLYSTMNSHLNNENAMMKSKTQSANNSISIHSNRPLNSSNNAGSYSSSFHRLQKRPLGNISINHGGDQGTSSSGSQHLSIKVISVLSSCSHSYLSNIRLHSLSQRSKQPFIRDSKVSKYFGDDEGSCE